MARKSKPLFPPRYLGGYLFNGLLAGGCPTERKQGHAGRFGDGVQVAGHARGAGPIQTKCGRRQRAIKAGGWYASDIGGRVDPAW